MPRVGIEQYAVVEEPNSKTSSGTGNVQTFRPTSERATAVLLTVEGIDARVTFGGATPGVGTGPGVRIPAGTAPLIYVFAFTPGVQLGPIIQFAANSAGNSTMSVIWLK
jgi:hypothetical protein